MSNPKLRAMLLLLVFTAAYVMMPAIASAKSTTTQSSLAVPMTAAVSPSTTTGPLSSLGTGTFAGTFNIQKFVASATGINAVGTLVGTVTGAGGQLTNVVVQNVAVPVTVDPASSCQILTLTLGPLHLDVLGLVIDLNQINLNITAQPGSGNLLGNLLCSVAGLLDNNTGLANLLNQILAALGL